MEPITLLLLTMMGLFLVLTGAMMVKFLNGEVLAPLNHQQLVQLALHQLMAQLQLRTIVMLTVMQNFSLAWMNVRVIPFALQTAPDCILNVLLFATIQIMFHQRLQQLHNLQHNLQRNVMLIVMKSFLRAWMSAPVILFALQTVLNHILNVLQFATIPIMSHRQPNQPLQRLRQQPQQSQPQLQLRIQFLFAITIVMKITTDVLATAEDTTKSALNCATLRTHSVLLNVTIQITFQQPNHQPLQQQSQPLQPNQPLQQLPQRQQPNSMLLLVMTLAMMNISNVLRHVISN